VDYGIWNMDHGLWTMDYGPEVQSAIKHDIKGKVSVASDIRIDIGNKIIISVLN
jgi:hypothetical protein